MNKFNILEWLYEYWLPIKGYEGFYEVSNWGRIRSIERIVPRGASTLTIHERIMTPKNNGVGYFTVGLQKGNKAKYCLIHRLVAEAFIQNTQNLPEVNHKTENKNENMVWCLEWCDSKYNKNYGTGKQRRQYYANIHFSKSAEKAVEQYTLNGEYIKTYKSSHEAARENNIKYQGNIINCCKGRCSYAYGYVWKYKEN